MAAPPSVAEATLWPFLGWDSGPDVGTPGAGDVRAGCLVLVISPPPSFKASVKARLGQPRAPSCPGRTALSCALASASASSRGCVTLELTERDRGRVPW